ncbi:MAG: zinc ribbon domain-containing protein [Deltaproteobacteria bacterium]|nr:zinc ribbon domain-containing protein [Deltaproteobacteria bacterium]
MPIYEYRCTKCGNEFEQFQSITDETIPKCAACKGKAKRLISQSSFHLKGSGWYVTDYGGKKPSFSDAKEDKSSTSTEDTAESTTATSASSSDKSDD